MADNGGGMGVLGALIAIGIVVYFVGGFYSKPVGSGGNTSVTVTPPSAPAPPAPAAPSAPRQ